MDNFQVVGKSRKGRRYRSSGDNKPISNLRTSSLDSVGSNDFQNAQTLMDKIENCRLVLHAFFFNKNQGNQ